jgi:hypothetical protein
MFVRCLQMLSVALVYATVALASQPLAPGGVYNLKFQDVDGQDLTTAGGHVTIITVATRETEDKARTVADLVPDRYIGNPKYRYVTLVDFAGKLPRALQGLTRTIIRGRLDHEAKLLKPQYEAKQIARDPRKDIYVIADFDGNAAERLGVPRPSADVTVFLFDTRGKLVARWSGVPPEEPFVKALASTE